MSEIWIEEKEQTEEFFDEVGYYITLNGEIASAYFISEGSEGDYVEQNKTFLRDFLIAQDKYPLYLTFITYDDNVNECITLFNDNKIKYTLKYLEEKRTYYTILKKHSYQPPCFTVMITDSNQLMFVIEETFWLPTQNEFYAISYSDNLVFQLSNVTEWGRKREKSIPVFNIEADTTFITIFHDGAGIYLFSNEGKYSTIDRLCSHLPEGTVITQINDTLL